MAHCHLLQHYFKAFLDKYQKAQQQLHGSRSTEQDWNLLQTCVSLLQHIGDFRMKLIEFEEKITGIVLEKGKEFNQSADKLDPYFRYNLTVKTEVNDLLDLLECASAPRNIENTEGVLSPVFLEIKPICEYVHDTTLASICAPIENNFKNIVSEQSISTDVSDLPDYSFAPQEFITVVGQASQIFYIICLTYLPLLIIIYSLK